MQYKIIIYDTRSASRRNVNVFSRKIPIAKIRILVYNVIKYDIFPILNIAVLYCVEAEQNYYI